MENNKLSKEQKDCIKQHLPHLSSEIDDCISEDELLERLKDHVTDLNELHRIISTCRNYYNKFKPYRLTD